MNTEQSSLFDQLRSELDSLRQRIDTLQSHLDELESSLAREEAPAPVAEEAVDLSDISFDALPEDDLPADDGEKEDYPQAISPAPVKAAVRENTDRYAWRKDMPGAPVRDIRSAIALNDRVLFINILFQQDAVRFQNTLNALNELESLPEAEDYLQTHFPQWNLDSEVVYRFMMAVRRKLR